MATYCVGEPTVSPFPGLLTATSANAGVAQATRANDQKKQFFITTAFCKMLFTSARTLRVTQNSRRAASMAATERARSCRWVGPRWQDDVRLKLDNLFALQLAGLLSQPNRNSSQQLKRAQSTMAIQGQTASLLLRTGLSGRNKISRFSRTDNTQRSGQHNLLFRPLAKKICFSRHPSQRVKFMRGRWKKGTTRNGHNYIGT